MSTEHRSLKWSFVTFVALWTLATVLGWAANWIPDPFTLDHNNMLFAGETLKGTSDIGGIYLTALGGVYGFLGGSLLGAAQLLVIFLDRGTRVWWWFWWPLATIFGMVIGWGLGSAAVTFYALTFFNKITNNGIYEPHTTGVWIWSGAAVAAFVGATVGICQWLVLWRLVRHAAWWIIVSILAWGAGGAIFWFVYGATGGPFFMPQSLRQPVQWPGYAAFLGATAIAWIAGGIVVGAVSGTALRLLLMHPRETSADSSNTFRNE